MTTDTDAGAVALALEATAWALRAVLVLALALTFAGCWSSIWPQRQEQAPEVPPRDAERPKTTTTAAVAA